MNKKLLQQIALIIGSLISITTLGAAIFVAANIINDIQISQFDFSTIPLFLLLILSIGSVLYAWSNKKVGSRLISLSSLLILIFNYIDFNVADLYWQQGSLLIAGLVILFSENYDKKSSK